MEVVEILKKLIAVKSLPGEEGGLAGVMRDLLGSAGVDKVFIDAVGNVIAPVRGGGLGVIVLEGHMDTVDAGDLTQWIVDPFAGVEVEGRVYGRGAVDMKGALASQVKALEGLKNLDSDLYVIYTVHEEIAEGVALRHALKESVRRRPDVIVTGEPSGLKLALGHRGRAVVELEISGVAAHASMPSEAVNALEGAASAVLKVTELSSKLPTHSILGSESSVATLIDCSPKIQPQIPDKCVVTVDHRVVPGRDENELLKIYENLCSEVMTHRNTKCSASVNEELVRTWRGVEMKVKEFFPGWINNDVVMVKNLLNSLKKLYSGASRHYWRFSTDLVITSEFNATGLGLGPGDDSLAHRPNEYVDVLELRKAVEIYRELLNTLSHHISSKVR
ncbi:MAG: M20/M25/M40 family metallo-hydrolase [Zestosphaera sp.]